LSFSFSDGRHTFDPSNTPFAVFTVGTDTAGAITTWQIYLEGDDLPDLLGDQYYELVTVYPGPLDPLLYPAADTGTLFECVTPGPEFCYTETDYAQVLNDPGTWTSHVDVPEPSSMLLVGAGLAGLAGFGRRRRQV
jgi:hypothetical protein